MTPDELDPYHLLASAALDNEVTADERARLQESPALLDEVETYRALAERIRAVEVPAGAREPAIAAALAAFDGLANPTTLPDQQRGSDQAALADIARMRALRDRRRRQNRWLGGAVAAALVGTLVVAAINARSNDSRSTAANSPTTLSTATPDTALVEQAGSAATKSAPDAAPNVAASTAAGTVPVDAGGAAAATAAGDDPWAGAAVLTDQQQLIAFVSGLDSAATAAPTAAATGEPASTAASATTAAAATAATTAAATTATPALTSVQATCPTGPGELLVPIIYLGERVYLVRDVATREIRILDPITCVVITTVPVG